MADAKRKRISPDEAQVGAARARAFLADFAALPLKSLEAGEGLEKAQALLSQLEADAAGIPALQALLHAADC